MVPIIPELCVCTSQYKVQDLAGGRGRFSKLTCYKNSWFLSSRGVHIGIILDRSERLVETMEKSTGTGSQLWSVQYNSGRFKINLDNLGPSDNSGITAEWSRIFPNKIVPYCTPNDPEWSKGLFRTIQEQLLAVCEVLKVHELYCKLKGTIWYLKTVSHSHCHFFVSMTNMKS